MGEKKVHTKSLSLRLWKNSCNFIYDGPIILVWVSHKKFEREGWIQKLFIVKPRASEEVKEVQQLIIIQWFQTIFIIKNFPQAN